jgi:hypothetical protein
MSLLVSACGVGAGVEVRIDEARGVPSVTGSTSVSIPTNFTCGTTITAGAYTVNTKVVTGGCEFSFDQNVEVIKAADYTRLPELQGATNLVQRVELTVKKLDLTDGAGVKLDLATRVTSANLSVNGQQVADKAALTNLPKVVTLSGAALTELKAKIDARQPASVKATCVVVLPDSPKPPDTLKVDYDAQPAIILGTGKIF